LDQLLTDARYSLDAEKRKELYSKAQKRAVEMAYWMPCFMVYSIYGANKQLANVEVLPHDHLFLQNATWRE
jgi:ABC-type transport system substrate-binding protein